jgi:hypothetical protein
MKSKTAIFAIGAIAALVGAFYLFYGGRETPPGQPALLSLNRGNFSVLKDSFNSAPRSVRLIALLSPT